MGYPAHSRNPIISDDIESDQENQENCDDNSTIDLLSAFDNIVFDDNNESKEQVTTLNSVVDSASGEEDDALILKVGCT